MSSKQERDEGRLRNEAEDRLEAGRLGAMALLEGAVADGVVSALGRPADFLRASAREIRGGRNRVNVFAGAHAGSARVAHSFVVTADADGRILDSSPPLAREYAAATPA